MAKVTGSMILAAIDSLEKANDVKMKAFEERMELKFKGMERVLDVRLDVQKGVIEKMNLKFEPIERNLGELSQHVFFIRVLCDIGRWFKSKTTTAT